MSARTPLPLRWLHAPPARAGSAAHTAKVASPVLSVYKPCGLPYFSASQLALSSDPGRLFNIDGASSGSAHTHPGSSPASASGFVTHFHPNQEDTSDSLSARLVDSLPLAATPHITLPIPSSLLLSRGTSGGHSASSSSTVSAATVNRWTSRYKGVTLVSPSQADAAFLRNASRMGFVTQTFHVLVRLPTGVAANARQHVQHAAALRTCNHSRVDGAGRLEKRQGPFLNPYVQEIVEGRGHGVFGQEAEEPDDDGIPITNLRDGGLPPSLRREPLLEGSLVDWRARTLRWRGSLSANLRTATPLSADMEAVAATKRRLSNLFVPSSVASACAIEDDAGGNHPWIPPEERLVVSVDAMPRKRSRRSSRAEDAGVGKRVTVSYSLLAMGGHPESELALYEVRGQHVAPEEVAALFAAEGFYAVNDVANDVALARVVAKAAEEVRRGASAASLGQLPVALQHRLASSTPEELVALPLMRQPLVAADDFALARLLEDVRAFAAAGLGMFAGDGGDELLTRLERRVGEDLSSHTPRSGGDADADPRHGAAKSLASAAFRKRTDVMSHLLHGTLARSKRLDDDDFNTLMRLAMGSSVECVRVTYPDPGNVATVLAMQHAMARFEEGRMAGAHREDLARSMRLLQTGTSSLHTGAVASANSGAVAGSMFGTTSVPRNGLHSGSSSSSSFSATSAPATSGFARAPVAMAEGVACTFALALGTAVGAAWKDRSTTTPRLVEEKEERAAINAVVSMTDIPPAYADFVASWSRRSGGVSVTPSREVMQANATDRAAPNEGRREGRNGKRFAAAGGAASQTVDALDARAAPPPSDSLSATQAAAPGVAPAAAAVPQTSSITPLMVRVEELGVLHCSSCGGDGHTWQCCPHHHLHDTTAATTGALVAADDGVDAVPRLPARVGDVAGAPVLTTTEEVRSILEAQGQRRAEGAARASGLPGQEDLIAVPRMAPTAEVNVHAMRREAAKPAMQRRAIRCAYCHGRHHISQCPKLSGGDASSVAASELRDAVGPDALSTGNDRDSGGASMTIDHARVREEPERLFCIKCGAHGHLFTSCPSIPANLHPATHCPVCLQSFYRVQHTPAQCPRRVSLPSTTEYFTNGIPRAYVRAEGRRHARAGRGDMEGRRGQAHERKRLSALQKRRRGSMLIADSFVDRQRR